MTDLTSRNRIPQLIFITDRLSAADVIPSLARLAVQGGADLVQIREKDLTSQELASLTHAVIEAVGERRRIAVNGDLSVAQELGTGIHLPERGVRPAEARALLGSEALIGRSVHSPGSARDSQGADYLIAGHVFSTASKPARQPIGLDGLRAIVVASDLPVIAIGGITAEHVSAVLEAGAYGVAVISAINASPEPEQAARAIRNRIDASRST